MDSFKQRVEVKSCLVCFMFLFQPSAAFLTCTFMYTYVSVSASLAYF